MIVDTIASPDETARHRIEGSVKTLLALLDVRPSEPVREGAATQGRLRAGGAGPSVRRRRRRFTGRPTDLPKDDSSVVIAVDHNACILCDRCVRGCDIIKENHVIGRMGKGYTARIAFDLESPMGRSSCVACGECSDDCPTGALTHRATVQTELPSGERVDVDGSIQHPNPGNPASISGRVARPSCAGISERSSGGRSARARSSARKGSTVRRRSLSRRARSRSSSAHRRIMSRTSHVGSLGRVRPVHHRC